MSDVSNVSLSVHYSPRLIAIFWALIYITFLPKGLIYIQQKRPNIQHMQMEGLAGTFTLQ